MSQGMQRSAGTLLLVLVLAVATSLAGCGGGGSTGGADGPGYDTVSPAADLFAGGPPSDVASAPDVGSGPSPAEDASGWWGGDSQAASDSSGWGNACGGCPSGQVCRAGVCVDEGCVPYCEQLQCGPDGCGGSCGWCSGQASCQTGVCVEVAGCLPQCAGQMIGAPDGCGGVCSGGGFGVGLKPGGAQDVGYFRRLLSEGRIPTSDLFPIEGFLNEHDTPLPPPDYDRFVTLHAFLGLFYDSEEEAPLLAMQLGMNSGIDPAEIEAKPFDLVVVVDTSGSMGDDGKLDFVRRGLLLLVESLDDNDTLAIVTYDDYARVAMASVAVTDETRPAIWDVIASLVPGGSTNLHAGMLLGYETAMRNIGDHEALHRVMLLSDGNITAGEAREDVILARSAEYNEEGIGITTIGVGSDFNLGLMTALASQGSGNFYFLEDGDRLVEVFRHEIEYLLTPVAQNLKISFELPPGFHVEDVYGFTTRTEGHTTVLLGPAPQYTVGPGDPPQPGGGGDVTVSTLFASKKNGLLMAKIVADEWDVFAAWDALDFAVITYSYDLVSKGVTEGGEETVVLGSLSYFAEDDPASGLAYFTGPVMQRNYCVLRAALAIREACDRYHATAQDVDGALRELADATTFCTAADLHLAAPDPALAEDIQLMRELAEAMCREAGCLVPR